MYAIGWPHFCRWWNRYLCRLIHSCLKGHSHPIPALQQQYLLTLSMAALRRGLGGFSKTWFQDYILHSGLLPQNPTFCPPWCLAAMQSSTSRSSPSVANEDVLLLRILWAHKRDRNYLLHDSLCGGILFSLGWRQAGQKGVRPGQFMC